MKDSRHFFSELLTIESFSEALKTELHLPLPVDWWIVIADVVESTKAIESGNYKNVNTIGVACIAAVLNVDRDIEIPFIFGGDGATFAVPAYLIEGAIVALRGVQKLSRTSFNLALRVGLVKVSDLAQQGLQVNVGKVRLSNYVTHATFSGKGWEEAERKVKNPDALDVQIINETDGLAEANFEGFECRWQNVPSFNGHKLSLLVAAMSDDEHENLKIYESVYEKIHEIYGETANYHPLRPEQMHLTLNPQQLSNECFVRSHHLGMLGKAKYLFELLLKGLAGMYLFAHNLDTDAVIWSKYKNELVENSDFRKFDGVLRMVIDGSSKQADELEIYLKSKYERKQLVYGIHKSKKALITCIVQSYTNNHLHFVDGSEGGYAIAARELKQQLKLFKK